ncbi:hypothetical protein FRC10_003337, partial [Ceratobasidium sp. 414]
MQGVGHLDAEGCERAWADLNQASRSSSEKGPGFRIDSLNSCMHDWNWRKITGIVSLILTKYTEAVRMATELETQWKEFSSSLDPALVSSWEAMSIEPHQEKPNVWTSVFLSKEGAATSITRKLLELNRLEQREQQQTSDHEVGFTALSWVSEGLEIEHQQKRLKDDLKSAGKHLTDCQALEFFNRHSVLSSRIIRNCQNAALFIDIIPFSLESLAEETDGLPEQASLYLPSRLHTSLAQTEHSGRVSTIEYQLRRVDCLRAIHRLKVASIQKKNAVHNKRRNARGEISNTWAQTVIDRLTQCADRAVWEYQNSQSALIALGLSDKDNSLFKPLQQSDLAKLTSILGSDRDLGEGHKQLPWFWSLHGVDKEFGQNVEDEVNK